MLKLRKLQCPEKNRVKQPTNKQVRQVKTRNAIYKKDTYIFKIYAII
jgi:hypothetical protein